MKHYLQEIGRFPLLTPQQEITLSRTILSAKELQEKPQLTAEEKRIVKRAEKAKRTLITANLRLVVHLAKPYTHRLGGSNMELMDLIQEGTFGLTRAAELFDYSRGYKFSTYAYWWIKQSITRAIDTKERLVRIPQHSMDKMYKLERKANMFRQEHKREPNVAEMAELLETNVKDVLLLLSRRDKHISLDSKPSTDRSSLGEFLVDTAALEREQDAEESAERDYMLRTLMASLSPEESDMIERRYGITAESSESLASIAESYQLSRERIRQRVGAAHNKMRIALRRRQALTGRKDGM